MLSNPFNLKILFAVLHREVDTYNGAIIAFHQSS